MDSRKRAKRASAPGTFTAAEWRELVARHNDCCAYCGTEGKLTADHRIPIARGGTNDIANIMPACLPCNVRKRTRTEAEFRAIA